MLTSRLKMHMKRKLPVKMLTQSERNKKCKRFFYFPLLKN
ncbi:hypothetical protein HMPREF0484_0324 [Klebsiella pneumoniae subsp. rhinoscleromatis ATCC 13884]|nr:hypothetical protein HMPREF0484_0324 [Klebsiella pneumoniae subsp. rhinoscleromatis ATCC 13884]